MVSATQECDMSTLRCLEPGWEQVGELDPAGRRGLWVRRGEGFVEFCAGREGDDEYVKLVADERTTHDLLGVISSARWASSLAVEASARAEMQKLAAAMAAPLTPEEQAAFAEHVKPEFRAEYLAEAKKEPT